MTIEEKYSKLLNRVKRWADLTTSQAEIEETSKREPDMGDGESDSFQLGQAVADAFHALECRTLLKSVGELGEGEMQ